ncbi:MAG: acetylornithine transaminase [Mycobacteriales bacterium]
MSSNEQLAAAGATHLMRNYGAAPIALVRGAGSTAWDADGNRYLDLLGGIAVSSLGHAHPRLHDAVSAQMRTLVHASNLYYTEPSLLLAERLLAHAGVDGRAFFCNSGAEAVEAAIKLALKRGRLIDPVRTGIVSNDDSFHGRTSGALSVTGQQAKREPFGQLLSGVTFTPYGDSDALRAAVGPHTAAIIIEPIQGEYGVVMPPAGYLAAARELATQHDALLILDEVQTGVGRTGTWFRWQAEGVRPDVMTLAKGLAGGLPIGVCIGFGAAGDVLTAGDHGSTFGGNPVVCAAALAVLDVIAEEGLLDRAKAAGERFADAVTGSHEQVDHVRGAGLLRGVVLRTPIAKQFETAARQAGFLVNAARPDVVRIAPPLIITDAELDSFAVAVPALLDAAAAAANPAG